MMAAVRSIALAPMARSDAFWYSCRIRACR